MVTGLTIGIAASAFTLTAEAEVLRSKKGITAVGNAQVDTAQSKFGGASAQFDGTGDYLQFPNNTITAADDFTVEAYIRLDVIPPSNNNWQMLLGNIASGGNVIYMAIKNRSGTIVSDIVLSDGLGNFIEQEYTIASISANVWYHWAICKSGGTLKHFFNGTELTTLLASSGTMTSAFGLHIASLIGTWNPGTWSWDGFIDEFRISNTARYTANFTPSTTPFVNDANTLLLLHFDGTNASTVFEDDNGVRGKKGITAIGNAQVDTAQSKFGGASALFDGTGDYLSIAPFSQSAGATFTFESWVRFAATPASGVFQMLISSATSGNRYLALVNVSGTLNWEIGHEGPSGTFYRRWIATVSTNTWYHIALTKNGTTSRLFVNGTLLTPSENFGTLAEGEGIFTETMRLGVWTNAGNGFNGHMDEVRISDTERYTTAFTPSTTPFVNDANTLLLMHCDGTDASTYFEDDNSILTVTPAATSVDEGSSLTFNVSTVSVPDQTLYYTVTNSGDFATSSGSFSLVSNAGSFSVTPTADTTTEGAETFTASVRTVSVSGDIIATSPSVTINDTSVAAVVVNTAFTDDADTKLLLHFNNNVTDDNSSGRTAVPGNLHNLGVFRTDQSKFGGVSVGSWGIPGGWQTTSTSFMPGTSDFTMEFWFRPAVSGNADQIGTGAQSNGSFHFFINTDTGFMALGRQNTAWDVQYTAGALSAQWYHIAYVKTAGNLKLYLNGDLKATQANSINYTTNNFVVNMGGNTGVYAYMDEFRMSHIARYTSNFTVA